MPLDARKHLSSQQARDMWGVWAVGTDAQGALSVLQAPGDDNSTRAGGRKHCLQCTAQSLRQPRKHALEVMSMSTWGVQCMQGPHLLEASSNCVHMYAPQEAVQCQGQAQRAALGALLVPLPPPPVVSGTDAARWWGT